MNQLRKSILIQEQKQASKRRFGLFSQPPPIAIGDDSKFPKVMHQRGGNGKPLTKPPQMLSGTCKSGLTKSSYFQVPQSININDKYIDKFKLQRQYDKKMHSKGTLHQRDFIPSSSGSTISKPVYSYKQQGGPQRKQRKLDQLGRVQIKPANFSTSPTSKVQTKFFKNPEYIIDPYERKEDFQKNYEKQKNKKILPETVMFRSMSHGNKSFSKDVQVYGQDKLVKQLMVKKKVRRSMSDLSAVKHQTKFMPSKPSYGSTIGKYPEYVSRKTKIKINDFKDKSPSQDKQLWKNNNFGYSKPSPSISLIFKNIKGKLK